MKFNPNLFFICFFYSSCVRDNNCHLTYKNSSGTYCLGTENYSKGNLEYGRFIFFKDAKAELFQEAGFYVSGFRNEKWFYRVANDIIELKWAYYKDKNLSFETNVFAEADSIKYGDRFTKIEFNTDAGPLSLTVSIDSPLKDSFPEDNYLRITTNQLALESLNVIEIDSSKVVDDTNTIFVYKLIIKDASSHKKYYLRTGWGFLNGTFIEFTTNSTNLDNFYNKILFDAVLTNFFYKKRRLYSPY